MYFTQYQRHPAINGLRRSEVLGDNLSARYIHNNHKLASLRQCDYYGLRSQNITKYFCELLQEVDDRISLLLFIQVSIVTAANGCIII